MRRFPGRPCAFVLLAPLVAGACDRSPASAELATFEEDCAAPAGSVGTRDDGYRGIWYGTGLQPGELRYKYSGGLGTYPQQHVPLAVYAPAVHRTFFVYGGRPRDRNTLTNMVSFYDHATGQVPRPVRVLERERNDAHFNPTLALDRAGYVYVFANVHGGHPGTSHIYRSTCPHSISAFTEVRADRFSYSQVWTTSGAMVWLHTRYRGTDVRELFWSTSADGLSWSEPRPLARVQRGHYQVSWGNGEKVATAFDHHPGATGLNGRTNLYYLESADDGATWTTAGGAPVATPLTAVDNPALVHDYAAERLLVYLKDLKFDSDGRPVILYLTSRGSAAGPESGLRTWRTARWTGSAWEMRVVGYSDHNYDHGSLYVEADGSWRVIAPLLPGPQPFMTGGDIAFLRSADRGGSWQWERTLVAGGGRNFTYVRVPVDAHPDFYALWADGNPAQHSLSEIHFATADGRAFRLPYAMRGAEATPEEVGGASASRWPAVRRSPVAATGAP